MTMLPTHPTIPSLMMFYWHRRRKLSEWRKTTLRFPLYVLLFTHFVCLFPCPYTSHFPFPIPSCIPSNASTYPTRIPPLVIGDLGVTMESFWTYVCFCVYFNYIFRLQLFFWNNQNWADDTYISTHFSSCTFVACMKYEYEYMEWGLTEWTGHCPVAYSAAIQ